LPSSLRDLRRQAALGRWRGAIGRGVSPAILVTARVRGSAASRNLNAIYGQGTAGGELAV